MDTEPLWKVPAVPATPNPFDPEPSVVEIASYVRRPRAETARRFTKGSIPPPFESENTPRTLDDLVTSPDGDPSVIVDDTLSR